MKKILTLCTVLALAFAMSIMFTACPADSGGGGDSGSIKPGLYAKAPPITGNDTPIDISGRPGATIVEKAVDYMKASTTSATFTLVLNENTTAAPQELTFQLVTLIGIGSSKPTITLSSAGSLFTIDPTASLTLENIILKGINANNAPLVNVKGGKLTMKSGSVITGNTNTATAGGGVYVSKGDTLTSGTFTLEGGEISNNKAVNQGGGVYFEGPTGDFTMSGGVIKGNKTTDSISSSGAGVYIMKGNFTMKGGEISDNDASSSGTSRGGGVYFEAYTPYSDEDVIKISAFTMSGGVIKGNKAYEGGGVYINEGHFTMSGAASISGNNASGSGGGVYLSYHPDFTFLRMAGGTIYGSEDAAGSNKNTAFEEPAYDKPAGAALYVAIEGTEVKRGTLSGNTFSEKGDIPVVFDEDRTGGAIETTIKVNSSTGALVP